MIDVDKTRELPEEMTDEWLIDFFAHCRDLGQNGNPGGYIMTVNLFPFIGIVSMTDHETPRRYPKPYDQWDYDGMRQWITENKEEALISWQRTVRSDRW